MWSELDRDFVAGQERQLLLNLSKVSMFRHAVRTHAFVAFGEQIVGLYFPPGTGNAAQTRDQNSFPIDGLAANERPKRNENACRITTRTCDEFRVTNLLAINFR